MIISKINQSFWYILFTTFLELHNFVELFRKIKTHIKFMCENDVLSASHNNSYVFVDLKLITENIL